MDMMPPQAPPAIVRGADQEAIDTGATRWRAGAVPPHLGPAVRANGPYRPGRST
jgi:hypothetical protein